MVGADLNTKGAKIMNKELQDEMEKVNLYQKPKEKWYEGDEYEAFNEGYTAGVDHLLPDLEKLAGVVIAIHHLGLSVTNERHAIARKYLPEGE